MPIRQWLDQACRPSIREPIRFRPTVEQLEDRVVLTTDMSPYEQLMVELINRARADPSAEAARYNIDLNEGLAPGTISTTAKQPLAPNQQILDAIRDHLDWLLNTRADPDFPLTHTGQGGTNPGQRMANASYAPAGTFGWGENLAFIWWSVPQNLEEMILDMHEGLFVDAGIPGRGHRTNMLSESFKEIGSGFDYGPYVLNIPAPTNGYAYFSGQDFGTRSNTTFLTGVFFTDDVVDDDFYTVGEQMAGITITATHTVTGEQTIVVTGNAGGYAMELGAGTYTVTASGPGLPGTVNFGNVTISTQNVKLDYAGDAVDATPPTANATLNNIATGGGASYIFTVIYSDDVAVDGSSIDNNDIRVTGPNGYDQPATLVNVTPGGNGTPQTATYSIPAPGGTWDPADNGTYTTTLQANQVFDTNNNPAASGSLGTFLVNIANISRMQRPFSSYSRDTARYERSGEPEQGSSNFLNANQERLVTQGSSDPIDFFVGLLKENQFFHFEAPPVAEPIDIVPVANEAYLLEQSRKDFAGDRKMFESLARLDHRVTVRDGEWNPVDVIWRSIS